MRRIAVSKVERGELYDELDADKSIRSLMAKRVEAHGRAEGRLVACDTTHAFAKAAHDAFYDHHPLVIRAEHVWFCIAQGFATHVNQNVEELRDRFVTHKGKEKLVVERPDFFLGQENPWPEAFEAFSEQIGVRLGKLRRLVSARFSTTTAIEAAAFDVTLMDAFQGYFEYEMRCGCGIPEIQLHGTPEDWRSMIPRVRHLSEYGLQEWVDAVVPVLERIVRACEGEDDPSFWESFFRYESGSGPAELTGWILTLFPYLTVNWTSGQLGWNPYLSTWRKALDTARTRPRPGSRIWSTGWA